MFRFIFNLLNLIYSIVVSIVLAPYLIFKQFKVLSDVNKEEKAEEKSADFFRALINDGQQAIKGIEDLSDDEIRICYSNVKRELKSIAKERNEQISKAVINGLVRDRIIDYVNEEYDKGLKLMVNNYSSYGIGATFIKGRQYQ